MIFACSAVDARRAVAPRECMSTSILMSHRPIMHLDLHLDRHAILWASWISVVSKSKYIREDREFVWDGSQLFAAHP